MRLARFLHESKMLKRFGEDMEGAMGASKIALYNDIMNAANAHNDDFSLEGHEQLALSMWKADDENWKEGLKK